MTKLCIMTTIPITIEAFWGEQLNFLHQNGFDITIITSPDERFRKSLPAHITYKPVAMTRVISPIRDFKAFLQIYKIFRQAKFDIVQYATLKPALFGSISGWLTRVPVRLYLMWGLNYVSQTGIKRCIFKFIDQMVCAFSTRIAPDSKGNVKFAVEDGLCHADKIGVVGHGSANGVDLERFNPDKLVEAGKNARRQAGIPLEARVLGYIGAFVGDKGVNELVAAFSKIADEYKDVYLLIVGQPDQKDPLKHETVNIINTHPKIRKVMWNSEPEKYFAAMDIFVLPTYREGFGVVNIEACAMKLPVISTDVPGPQESIINGETGILVPVRTTEPLVEAIKLLLNNPELGKKLGAAARKRVEKFYEQRNLWKAILEHRRTLLAKANIAKKICP